MANKRMFSREIMENDIFLNLSKSARLLYVYINLNADDDGFTARTRAIMSLCNADDKDLQELINTGFIIRFETGVIVVAHWNIHNTIQRDRYKETVYTYEKSLLINNKPYVCKKRDISAAEICGNSLETDWKQNGNIEEERIEEVKEVRKEENRKRVAVEKGEVQEGGTIEIELPYENFNKFPQSPAPEEEIDNCIAFYEELIKGNAYPNYKQRIAETVKDCGEDIFTSAIILLKNKKLDYSLNNIIAICRAFKEGRPTVNILCKQKR